MQETTQESVAAIKEIEATIGQISASAGRQQSAATPRNVQSIAQGTFEAGRQLGVRGGAKLGKALCS